jgi:AbrB family looped-hinge helix DNA binding protein
MAIELGSSQAPRLTGPLTFGMLTWEVRIPDFPAINPRPIMSSTARIQNKGQVTIPTSVRRQAGLLKGDMVKFAFQRGKIVITPTVMIDRSKFPTADDEYTPAQRRIIDARLAESEADYKAGRSYGPFNTADEMIADMRARLNKADAAKKLRSR